MSRWGLCLTVKAPLAQVEAFVAHHLHLGAAHLWVFVDDPDDPGLNAIAALPHTTVTRCTDEYWARTLGRRPDKHQNRQARNVQTVYRETDLPWLGHLDVDEFLWPARDVGCVLADLPGDEPMLRIAPWEALHAPGLARDIFTARHFRAALSGADRAGARDRVFGRHATLLPSGVLSHSAGKCFFRTGLSRFEPRLHGAFRAGTRVQGGAFTRDIALLHFHAEDPLRWTERLPFRLTRGAYQYNPPLQAWLMAANPAEIDAFYNDVQIATPDLLDTLRAEDALLCADLNLHDRIAQLKTAMSAGTL